MSETVERVSVVVVPLVGGDRLLELVDTLSNSGTLPQGSEILVVSPTPPVGGGAVRHVPSPVGASVPERRALGAAAATGDAVAFFEDTALPNAHWGHSVLELYARHPEAIAIGGTLRLHPDLKSRSAALAALEYGAWLRPGPVSERVAALPGNNLCIRRGCLERALCGRGLREAELIPELSRTRGAVRLESALWATCIDVDPQGARSCSRFQHGRLYAGRRFETSNRARRVWYAALAPALPPLMLARCVASLKRSGVSQPLPVLAHALWMSLCWSAGEALGYLAGPGDAERDWM